jgi:hypothetical protein
MQKLLESLGASLLRSHDISLHGPLETTASVPGGGGGEGRENREEEKGKYTVKNVCGFPIPSRDVTDYLNYSRPGRVLLVSSRLGTGAANLFLQFRN